MLGGLGRRAGGLGRTLTTSARQVVGTFSSFRDLLETNKLYCRASIEGGRQVEEVFIVSCARTPLGSMEGSLKVPSTHFHPFHNHLHLHHHHHHKPVLQVLPLQGVALNLYKENLVRLKINLG